MNLRDLKAELRGPIPVEYDGETLNLKYHPNEFTPELEAELTEVPEGERFSEHLLQAMKRVIESWDLRDKPEKDGGKILGVSVDLLRVLPHRLLFRIYEEINRDLNPPTPSASGSSPT